MDADHAAQQLLDAFRRHQAYLGFIEADGERACRVQAARHDAVIAAQGQHAATRRGVAGQGSDYGNA